MSNIAEGFERDSDAEFARYLRIAKGSTGEVRAQLYIALDQSYINEERFRYLVGLTNEISRMIVGLLRYLTSQANRPHSRPPQTKD